MQKMRNLRTYYIGVLVLTFLATLLRTLALTLAFNRADGYFKAGEPLPILLVAFLAFAGIAILLYPLLLKGRVPQVNTAAGKSTQIASVICAILFLVTFVSTCMARNTLALPTMLWLVGILSLLAAAVYFFTKLPVCAVGVKGQAVFGSLALIAVACLITVTYFDVSTPMNTPHKVHLHLALLAVLVSLLYELRDTVEAPMPRMRTAFTALAVFFSISIGLSDLIAALTGYALSFTYLSQDCLLLGLGLYTATRGVHDLKVQFLTERKTTAE